MGRTLRGGVGLYFVCNRSHVYKIKECCTRCLDGQFCKYSTMQSLTHFLLTAHGLGAVDVAQRAFTEGFIRRALHRGQCAKGLKRRALWRGLQGLTRKTLHGGFLADVAGRTLPVER